MVSLKCRIYLEQVSHYSETLVLAGLQKIPVVTPKLLLNVLEKGREFTYGIFSALISSGNLGLG